MCIFAHHVAHYFTINIVPFLRISQITLNVFKYETYLCGTEGSNQEDGIFDSNVRAYGHTLVKNG